MAHILPSVFKTDAERDRLIGLLKSLDVGRVDVQFSGGGDSGSINMVEFLSNEKDEKSYSGFRKLDVAGTSVPDVPRTREIWNDMSKSWETIHDTVTTSLGKYAEQLCYDALEESGLDWYNNDGGYGSFAIAFKENGSLELELNVSINYTRTDDYSFGFGSR